MARESRVSGAPANSRRVSVPAEPQRPSRRIPSRRNSVSRPSVALRKEPAHTPRNSRVLRAPPPERTGPSWPVRASIALWTGTKSAAFAVARGARGGYARLSGPIAGRAGSAVRVLMVCAFIVGAGALGRFVQRHLTTAPAFQLDRIDVKGLSRLERAELLETAGLTLGMNVFARSPDDVRARLLRHPWIVSADVQRRLPSRFEILVRERDPVALFVVEACPPATASPDVTPCDDPSALYLVSAEGKMFKRLSGKDPVDLPVITGVTRDRLARDPDFSRRVLIDAVALLQEYQNSGLFQRSAIGEIHVEANDGLSLYIGDDLTYVRLGTPPFTQKLSRLKRVFERLQREQAHAEYVYLDNEQHPERVTVRVR